MGLGPPKLIVGAEHHADSFLDHHLPLFLLTPARGQRETTQTPSGRQTSEAESPREEVQDAEAEEVQTLRLALLAH
jgi:hypothetical protein